MSIKSLRIKNFKSIVDIDITDISKFSLFAGANGCGKSNLFQALEFIRDVIRNGAKEAIRKHNGFEHIHSHKLKNGSSKKFYAKLTICSVVRNSQPKELFLVDKKDGRTEIKNALKEYPDYDYSQIGVDKMWMSNMFDGGLPW